MAAARSNPDPAEEPCRIQSVKLDNETLVRWSAEVEHERQVAMFDLLEANHFRLIDGPIGPYDLFLGLKDTTLILEARPVVDAEPVELRLPMRPFRTLIKDYFLICESYFNAIKTATPSRIEAIDMARRGLHDEGAEEISDALAARVEMDRNTARRLFTLICVLHVRG
ncbi:MAG: UPF0262 family protein [Geminicoccaceae bacterium]|nr:MAG: UPF0262 family protein [Geminicoccaceae bacterium]